MKYNILLLFSIIVIPIIAKADAQIDKSQIEPGKVHEVCMTLTEGQNLAYFFKSSVTMNFNIHYHEGDEVIFPVEEYPTNMGSDVFTAPINHGYCLMWTNASEMTASLEVRYEVQ